MDAESIPVHVNRGGQGSIEIGRESVSTDRSFELALQNHGEPTHVHCRLTGTLADVAEVEETNQFVEAGETTVVPVTVGAHEGERSGGVELSTGFGATASELPVTLLGGVGEADRVDVDERLAEPQRPEPEPGVLANGVDLDRLQLGPSTLGLVGLGGLALLAALGAALVVGGTAGILGVGVVAAGFIAAFVLIFQ